MKTLVGVLTAFAVPLLVLNVLGGIVSGVWLAVIGQWGAIGYGLFFGLAGSVALSLAMLPGLVFAAPAVYFEKRGNRAGLLTIGLLSVMYTMAVISAWCTFILVFFAHRATNMSGLIALLIWSYGVALGPLMWMSKSEAQSGNDASSVTTFAAQIAYVVVALLVLTVGISTITAFAVVGALTFVFGAAQLVLATHGSATAVPDATPA